MKAIVKLTERITLEIDERDEMETLSKAITLAGYPKKCNVCSGDRIWLSSNKDKEGNVYINAICTCGAKAKLGQYKTGGFFWHKFEKYEKKREKTDVPF